MNVEELQELIKSFSESGITELKFEKSDLKVNLKKELDAKLSMLKAINNVDHVQGDSSLNRDESVIIGGMNFPVNQSYVQTSEESNLNVYEAKKNEEFHKIVSPMVGTFYTSTSPGAESFVKKGQKVEENTVVCIVEAMKLFNEIESEIKGEVVEVLAENGQLVEFGQPLFLLRKE